MRAGLSCVPSGKRMLSISRRRELSEPKISSVPSLPVRNAEPVASAASVLVSESILLPSMERLDFLGN